MTGRPLQGTSVKETACEAIITHLGPDEARHSTPQPCQSVWPDTGRRAHNVHKTAYVSDRKGKKKKKRCCSEEIYTFPCHSAFPPFPPSCLRKASSQNTCSRILTCPSSACFADRSEADAVFRLVLPRSYLCFAVICLVYGTGHCGRRALRRLLAQT